MMTFITDLFQEQSKWSLGRIMAAIQFAVIMKHYLNAEALTENQVMIFLINMGYVAASKYRMASNDASIPKV